MRINNGSGKKNILRCLENIYLIKKLTTFPCHHLYPTPFSSSQKEVVLDLTDRFDKVTRLKFMIYTK